MMTLGSLFDGVGGWQLAAVRNGIKPLWSSEIEEFCLSVTRRHFPDTVQLGDINGIADAPHVDIVTAGSALRRFDKFFVCIFGGMNPHVAIAADKYKVINV